MKMRHASKIWLYGRAYGYPMWANDVGSIWIRVPLTRITGNHANIIGSWYTFNPKTKCFDPSKFGDMALPTGPVWEIEKHKAILYIKHTSSIVLDGSKEYNDVYFLDPKIGVQ